MDGGVSSRIQASSLTSYESQDAITQGLQLRVADAVWKVNVLIPLDDDTTSVRPFGQCDVVDHFVAGCDRTVERRRGCDAFHPSLARTIST